MEAGGRVLAVAREAKEAVLHPSLSVTRLAVRVLEAFCCALALGAGIWALTAAGSIIPAALFTVIAAGVGLLLAGSHVVIPLGVQLTHHGRRLLKHHPRADAVSSSALCLIFIAATALLFNASASRGCVLSAVRRGGAGAALSLNGTASKEAELSFALEDHVHQWPLSRADARTQAHVGWTMLLEVLFAGQLSSTGTDPRFQKQLAGFVKRVWAPYTTDARTMRASAANASSAATAADDGAMAEIFDAGQISLNPRGADGAGAGLPPFRPIAGGGGGGGKPPALRQLAAYVNLHPDNSTPAVGPVFVGYDMVETTLRAYQAGESPAFVAAVGPYIRQLWAPRTQPLEADYDSLSDYEKVMVDTYNAGTVSFDAFRPLEGAEERRRAAAAAQAATAAVFTTVCALLEAMIAASLLCSAAFGGSAILAGLEIRCVCLQNFIHPYNAGLLCSAAFGGSAILAGLEIRRVKRSRLGPVKGEVASFHDDRAASPGLQGLGVTAEEEETDDTTQGPALRGPPGGAKGGLSAPLSAQPF